METRENPNRRIEVTGRRRPSEEETPEAPQPRLREGGRWYPAQES